MANTLTLPINDTWYAGDTMRIELAIKEEGVPVDLTGYDLKFTAKKNAKDADNAIGAIQKSLGDGIEVIDAANGEILITIDPDDTTDNTETVTYFIDLQMSFSGEVVTVFNGTLTVNADITQTI